MAVGFLALLFPLLSLVLFFGIPFAKPIAGFPSKFTQPEKLSPSAPNELYKETFFTQILDELDAGSMVQIEISACHHWSLASSSPILNFESITSPYSFNNIITQDSRGEREDCYEAIKGSWQENEDTASQPGGLEIYTSKVI